MTGETVRLVSDRFNRPSILVEQLSGWSNHFSRTRRVVEETKQISDFQQCKYAGESACLMEKLPHKLTALVKQLPWPSTIKEHNRHKEYSSSIEQSY